MKFFPNQLFIAINDKKRNEPVLTFSEYNEEQLKLLNQKNHGIFFSVNSFKDGIRQTANLLKLNAVYADLDVAKAEDNLSLEIIQPKKNCLLSALKILNCPPSLIIETRNGLQPLWFIEETTDKELYRSVIEGIIDWSKGCGALGDEVKDVTRVLRMPGFYHNKQEPFLIKEIFSTDAIYSITELSKHFKREQKPTLQSTYPQQDFQSVNPDPTIDALNKLDIRDVIIAVWQEKGRNAEFNALNQLIVDGQQCATFVNREGKNFVSNGGSSDYPAQGNAVTYIAETLRISNKEAFKWIVKKFNLEGKIRKEIENNISIMPELGEIDFYKKLKKAVSYPKTLKIGIHEIAKYLVRKYHIKTIGDYQQREIYIYDGGFYNKAGANILLAEVEKILEEVSTKHYRNEIVEKIKDMTFVKREDFLMPRNLINLKNGIFNLDTKTLNSHDPSYLFLHQIPVNYVIDASCVEIKKCFSDLLDEKDILIIQEWLGFALYRKYFIKKALILHGDRNRGKTTLLNIITRFLGAENIAGVSLQKIASDKFSMAHLYEKHLNIYDDLSFNDLNDNGAFKMATGGGYVTGEFKFGGQFIFENFAKLVFSCNKIPLTKDVSDDAYFSRWIPIELTKTISKEKMDSLILGKILTDQEMSGLLNFALAGFYRIFNGYREFSYNKEVDEIKAQMLKSSSSIANFVLNCLEFKADNWISKEELYSAYANFTSEGELGMETKEKFGRDLIKYAGYIIDSKGYNDSDDKKQITGWRNVSIKNLKKVTKSDTLPF